MKLVTLIFVSLTSLVFANHLNQKTVDRTEAEILEAKKAELMFQEFESMYKDEKTTSNIPMGELEKDLDFKATCYEHNLNLKRYSYLPSYAHFYSEVPDKPNHLGLKLNTFESEEKRDSQNVDALREKSVSKHLFPELDKANPIKDKANYFSTEFGNFSEGMTRLNYSVKKYKDPHTGKNYRFIKYTMEAMGERIPGVDKPGEIRNERYCVAEQLPERNWIPSSCNMEFSLQCRGGFKDACNIEDGRTENKKYSKYHVCVHEDSKPSNIQKGNCDTRMLFHCPIPETVDACLLNPTPILDHVCVEKPKKQ